MSAQLHWLLPICLQGSETTIHTMTGPVDPVGTFNFQLKCLLLLVIFRFIVVWVCMLYSNMIPMECSALCKLITIIASLGETRDREDK